METVMHNFRWVLMRYVGQPFFHEYARWVAIDRLHGEDFSPRRVLLYIFFKKHLGRFLEK